MSHGHKSYFIFPAKEIKTLSGNKLYNLTLTQPHLGLSHHYLGFA